MPPKEKKCGAAIPKAKRVAKAKAQAKGNSVSSWSKINERSKRDESGQRDAKKRKMDSESESMEGDQPTPEEPNKMEYYLLNGLLIRMKRYLGKYKVRIVSLAVQLFKMEPLDNDEGDQRCETACQCGRPCAMPRNDHREITTELYHICSRFPDCQTSTPELTTHEWTERMVQRRKERIAECILQTRLNSGMDMNTLPKDTSKGGSNDRCS